jgi:uncharacterized protein YbjT (DUF2867 family)
MKIVVIGGAGFIGSRLVASLQALGHEAIAAAPNTGVNTVTGEGLADVLVGADVVVDVANSPSFEDEVAMRFFRTAGQNLLAAEQVAGVHHHVALSVVGTERLQASGYFRAKLAQEDLIKASGVPYTILRSTQFFPFIEGIIKSGGLNGVLRLPTALAQPIHADDVVAALAEIATDAPVNGTVEIAGPEAIAIDLFAEEYLSAKADPRQVIADASAPYFGAALTDNTLLPGANARIGQIRLEDWFHELIPAD